MLLAEYGSSAIGRILVFWFWLHITVLHKNIPTQNSQQFLTYEQRPKMLGSYDSQGFGGKGDSKDNK